MGLNWLGEKGCELRDGGMNHARREIGVKRSDSKGEKEDVDKKNILDKVRKYRNRGRWQKNASKQNCFVTRV